MKEMVLFTLTLILFQSCFHWVEAAKILLMASSINSHLIYISRLGEGLGKLGHSVEILAPSNGKIPYHMANMNFTITPYKVHGKYENVSVMNTETVSKLLLEAALTESYLTKFYSFYKFNDLAVNAFEEECLSFFGNKELMQNTKTAGYQFAIIDLVMPLCYTQIPESLKIPYAIISVAALTSPVFRVPRLPSFTPFVFSGGERATDEMTFNQRLSTLLHEFLYLTFYKTSRFYAERHPTASKKSTFEHLQGANLWLFLEDLSVGYARPNMPNTISIGDIMAGQPEKLIPPNLEEFLQHSNNGAILVSFGSFLDHVPEFITKSFCSVFRQVKFSVIWKFKNVSVCNDAKNVKVLPWIPQNDLLAHPKISLFITHGGINSLTESISHGKPVIVFPFALDQPGNAAVATSKGYGIHMDITKFTPAELRKNIERIFNEPSFTENAKLYSNIMKHKPEKPEERVSFMIEHIIKHGDKHLRTGAYKLNLFQFYMFDIFSLILFFVILLFLSIFGTLWCICIACKNRLVRINKLKSA